MKGPGTVVALRRVFPIRNHAASSASYRNSHVQLDEYEILQPSVVTAVRHCVRVPASCTLLVHCQALPWLPVTD